MNERVPDSTGLPLRAMVMVLLFLGVIFLLVGLQAMGTSGSSDEDSSAVSHATTTAPATPKGAAVKSDVRVYNVSGQPGVASRTADRLRSAGYNVTDVGNLDLPNVPATTVYFSPASGEHETADAVGKVLAAPVAPRTPDVADQPPGVIVVVTG